MTTYRTVLIDGLDIFYREAGSRDNPTILLLHGFPTSSHMFHNLIPALADKFHKNSKGNQMQTHQCFCQMPILRHLHHSNMLFVPFL